MIRVLTFIFIYLIAGVMAFASQNEEREKVIVLANYVDVAPGPIKFGNLIASYKNIFESPLYDLVLGEAPVAGAKLKFSNVALSQAVGHYIANLKNVAEKEKLQSTKIIIPKDVEVQGAGWAASTERLYHLIPVRLQRFCDYTCEVVIDEIVPPKAKSSYTEKTQFEIADFKAMPKGPFIIEASVANDKGVNEKIWIQGKLRVLKEVPVTKRMIVQGERLKEDDFEIKKMDITMESDTPLEAQSAVGSKLKRTVSANQIILNSAIEREKDVVFGQPVQVVIRNPDWTISLEAIARDTGSVGDRIKIYNPQSKKTLSGVLVSKGVVEIQ